MEFKSLLIDVMTIETLRKVVNKYEINCDDKRSKLSLSKAIKNYKKLSRRN